MLRVFCNGGDRTFYDLSEIKLLKQEDPRSIQRQNDIHMLIFVSGRIHEDIEHAADVPRYLYVQNSDHQ